jgi:hypothetical protein
MKVIFFVNTGDTKMPRGGGGKGKPTGKTVKHKVSKLANIVTKVVGGASGSTSRQPHSPPVASSPPRRQHTRRRLGSRPSAHKQVEAEVEERMQRRRWRSLGPLIIFTRTFLLLS